VQVLLNGVDTYYETAGSGPALICVHGGPGLGDHRRYKRWLAPLAGEFTLVYYDLRGCGRSADPANGRYSHADFVADLDALRAHLSLEKIAVLGTSYGGFISLEYALAHQDRLTHLLLADTAASKHHDEAAKRNALASDLPIDRALLLDLFEGRMRDDEEFRRAYAMIQPLYRAQPDPAADATALAQMAFRHLAHNYAFSRNLPAYDLRHRLHEIEVPTLVLCGRHDWITPLEESEAMAKAIPNATLMVFDHSGHSPMMEENEAFLAALRGFLASREPGRSAPAARSRE
jgi:proline-specific peptidase